MSTYIGAVQLDILSPPAAIGSSLFGICNSNRDASAKEVILENFDRVYPGITIHVKFTQGNIQGSNATLKVSNTDTYPITGHCLCDVDEVLAFTFDNSDNLNPCWRANGTIVGMITQTTTDSSLEPVLFGLATSTNNGATYTLTVNESFTYLNGLLIHLKFNITNQANATLQLNSLPAKPLYYENNAITAGKLKVNYYYTFIYQNDQWNLIGELDTWRPVVNSLTSDSTDSSLSAAQGKALKQLIDESSTSNHNHDTQYANINHTHGNISNNGMLNTANALVKTGLDGAITVGPLLGNSATSFLNQLGNWTTITASDIGINDPIQFIGVTSTILEDGAQATTILINNTVHAANPGELVLDASDGEFICVSENQGNVWRELGTRSAFKLKQAQAVELGQKAPIIDVNKFISYIKQDTNGNITGETAELDTSGTWSGTAAKATEADQWSRDLYVYADLGNNSTDTIINGHPNSNLNNPDSVGIRVSGTLGIENGGLGRTLSSSQAGYALFTPTVTEPSQIELRACVDTNAPNNAGLDSESTSLVTERYIYFTRPQFNESLNYDSSDTFYMPITSGIMNQSDNILISNSSNNSTVPQWASGASIHTQNNITSLTLGIEGSQLSVGQIELYNNANTHKIVTTNNNSNQVYTHTLPNNTGTLLTTNTSIGSNTQGIYLDDNYIFQAQTYIANRLYYSASTTSFTATNHYATAQNVIINYDPLVFPIINNIPNFIVHGTTKLDNKVGIGIDPADTNSNYILTINGQIQLNSANNSVATFDIFTNNNITELLFIPSTTANGQLGTTTNRWRSAVFSDSILVQGYNNNGNNNAYKILITNDANSSQINFSYQPVNSNELTWSILNNLGNLNISNGLASEISGTINGFTISNNLTINDNTASVISPNLIVWGGTNLRGSVGINTELIEGYALTINGDIAINKNLNPSAYIKTTVNTTNNKASIVFYPENTEQSTIGILNKGWEAGYFKSLLDINAGLSNAAQLNLTGNDTLINFYNSANNGVNIKTWFIEGTATDFTIGNSNQYIQQTANTWVINGDTGINTNATNNYSLTIQGDILFKSTHYNAAQILTYEDTDTSRAYINFTPENDNLGSLGSDSKHWGHVYIGTQNTYGDEYSSIYWNNGVPTPTTTVIKRDFIIPSNATITFTNNNKAQMRVIALVVTNGFSNLYAPLKWQNSTSLTNQTTITISINSNNTLANGQTIEGYIIVAFDTELNSSNV